MWYTLFMSETELFKKPKVSIIVTCYNLGKYIPDCIKSIENQTYKNFEVIVVNDASVDDTKEIIDLNINSQVSLSKLFGVSGTKKYKVLHLKENLGQFGAFLEGLNVATGEFVCMVDADDVLCPDYLKVHLDTHMKTSVAFTSCAQFEIDDNSVIHSLVSLANPLFKNEGYKSKKSEDDIFNIEKLSENYNVVTLNIKHYPFGTWNWNPTSSAMMRKSAADFLLRYPTPSDWKKGADKIAFSFLHLIGGSALISAPLMAYRRHKTNLSCANPVLGNMRYLKPDAVNLYINYNKRIRFDTLKFIFKNYDYFCYVFNPLNVRRMIWRIIFSFDANTIKRVFKSFFVK